MKRMWLAAGLLVAMSLLAADPDASRGYAESGVPVWPGQQDASNPQWDGSPYAGGRHLDDGRPAPWESVNGGMGSWSPDRAIPDGWQVTPEGRGVMPYPVEPLGLDNTSNPAQGAGGQPVYRPDTGLRNSQDPDRYGFTNPGWGAEPAYEGYRFRGDPPSSPGAWQVPSDQGGYRFRPLSEQERQRIEPSPGQWRPLETPRDQGGRPQPGLFDSMTPRGQAYGFEPDPWSGR